MSSDIQDVRLRRATDRPHSRSPHPYRRRAGSLKQNDWSSSGTDIVPREFSAVSDSAEDPATEADDEKGRLLRLPAPPQRARKGLKGQHDPSIDITPGISPVQSPVVEKLGFELGNDHTNESLASAKQDRDELYSRYTRRRRSEIVRRSTEFGVLLVVCVLSTANAEHIPLTWSPSARKWKSELMLFCIITLLCYVSYPFRRTVALCLRGTSAVSAFRRGFHIPSRFDPGPLLYPVVLPICIALSLGGTGTSVPLNITLSLASIPTLVAPFSKFGFPQGQWIMTIIPVSELSSYKHQPSSLRMDTDNLNMGAEELCLVFPLHRTLALAISGLVGKSLDISEIELMSAGLINLLVLATSPEAQILKALLWVGGLCIFILCEPALRAEVALARVPSWRFARNRPSNRGLTGRINRILRAILPENRSVFALSTSSDSDDDIKPMQYDRRLARTVRKSRVALLRSATTIESTASADEQSSAIIRTALPQVKTKRSATFSVYGRATTMAIKFKKIAESPNPFPRLNLLHAQALKYLLAVFVYIAVAFVILVPIRHFISNRALSGAEPIGWAIGYFIGDNPSVRLLAISSNLDWWIRLPTNKAQSTSELPWSWMDRTRVQVIGAANVRLLLAGYCVVMVAIGIGIVLHLKHLVEVDTRRKVFHGVMVAMLLSTIPVDPTFFALALEIVLVVFLMLDVFRASQLPPISRPLTTFLAPYIDGRDYRGPVVVSPIFLLIGCAIPLWLSLADAARILDSSTQGWEVPFRNLGMVSGVICVGMGDAAASLIGRRYGRTKWYWGGGKSLEGSTAFALAVWAGLMATWTWLRIGGWVSFHPQELPTAMVKALAAGIGASIMESTLTAANDNVIVPIVLWLLVRGLVM